jgi:succinoglycan biosynthesis transport protein ExoP
MNEITRPSGSLRDILHVIFKYKLLIIFAIALSLSCAVYINSQYVPVYMSTATLLIKIGKENIETLPTGGRQMVAATTRDRLNNELVILKSRKIAENTINNIGMDNIIPGMSAELGAMILRTSLSGEIVQFSNIIKVSLRHWDRKQVAKILNVLIDEYIDHHLKIYQQSEVRDFFDDQVNVLNEKITKTSDELQNLKETYNISELRTQKSGGKGSHHSGDDIRKGSRYHNAGSL